ncbi:hypothetical protein [Kitasatospora sp. NPDC094015]|uniref:hypothetical protein n=1 Tax=Kitasatospora sp. NPDC094015 TaxID=3155205 RepID=UPI0033185918
MTAIDSRAPGARLLPAPAAAVRLPVPARLVDDLTRDLSGAADAVRSMPGRAGDVTVAAYTAVVCTGGSAADALRQAADWCRQAPEAEIHSSHLARVPGHREDVWEYTVTLAVSFPDPETGEHPGHTHTGRRPQGR